MVAAALAGGILLAVRLRFEAGGAMVSTEMFRTTGTYAGRFAHFFVEGLPGALGLRAIFTHDWIAGGLGVAAYLLVLVALAWSLRRGWPVGASTGAVGWAAVGFVVYPFIYARSPS